MSRYVYEQERCGAHGIGRGGVAIYEGVALAVAERDAFTGALPGVMTEFTVRGPPRRQAQGHNATGSALGAAFDDRWAGNVGQARGA